MRRLIPLALFAPISIFAQQAPDAGQLLQQVRPAPVQPIRVPDTKVEEPPAPTLADGQRVRVQGFRITGSSVVGQDALLPLLADAVGKELSLAQLDALAMRITRRLREMGLFVARAYLPPQEIRNGVVEIAVLEGRLGSVKAENSARLAASALAPLELLAPGDPVSRRAVEGSLLALAELSGVEVKSVLRPGAEVGTSDLLVQLSPGPALSGSVNIDNFGNRYTGATQLGASVFWNNPAGRGDQAALRAETAGDGFRYARLGYQLPFGREATRIGAAASHMRYRLGKEFDALHADGDATTASLFVTHPFVRGRDRNWSGQIQYERKRLVDRVGSTSTTTEKSLDNLTLGLNGSFADAFAGGASNSLSLAATRGRLHLDEFAAAVDEVSSRGAGSFSKLTAFFQRVQQLPSEFSLAFSLAGQWSDKNLDSSEKMLLGGANGVRAYPPGEALGDEGRLVALELRRPLSQRWDVRAFYDDGHVTINRHPWAAGANSRHLAGYGLGAGYAAGRFTVRMFAAWKAGTGQPTSAPDRSPRLWAQAVMSF